MSEDEFGPEENEDDDNVVDLNPEEVQEIIDWAVSSGTIVTLMVHRPAPETPEEYKDAYENLAEGIQLMYDNLPNPLAVPVHDRAVEIIDEAQEEERIVAEFRDEIEKNL